MLRNLIQEDIMNKIKKSLCVIAALMMAACSAPEKGEEESGKAPEQASTAALTAGTYEGSANSVGGPLDVKVTVTEDKIESIEITDTHDTDGIGSAAFDRLIPMMIENQSTNVDTVSGATLSSMYLKNAVRGALEAAGASKDDFNEAVTWSAPAQSDMDVDVVVIGGGLGGMSAATQAANLGLKTVLVEKLAYLGGDALVSDQSCVNVILPPANGAFEPNMQALADQGVPITAAEYPGFGENSTFTIEGAGDFDLMYLLMKHMRTAAEKNDAVFLTDTPATGLLVDHGKVVGIKAQPKGQDEFKINSKAVILATGGFNANTDLVNKYLSYAQGARAMGLGGTKGDALIWAQQLGAKTIMLDAADSSFMLANPATGAGASFGYLGNNYVNAKGEPVTDDVSYNLGAEAVYKAVGSEKVFNVYPKSDADAQSFTPFLEKSVHNLTAVYYDTLDEVIAAYGMDQLADTMKARGYKGDEGFYVMEGIACIYGTYGGIAADEANRVVNQNDEVIEGLYAAGEVIGSREYQQTGAYGGGLAPAFALGYVAAESAYEDINK